MRMTQNEFQPFATWPALNGDELCKFVFGVDFFETARGEMEEYSIIEHNSFSNNAYNLNKFHPNIDLSPFW